MKKFLLIAISVVVVLSVALAIVLSAWPSLKGSGSDAHASAVELEQTVSEPLAQAQTDYAVVAEGVVVPLQYATLSMAASGIVAEVMVQEGAMVEEGQVIVKLHNAHQQAALAEAEAALASAQAGLDALEAGARLQEIDAGQASLDAVQARLGRLVEGARPEDIAAAEASLAAAKATLQRLYDGPDEHTRIAAKADLDNAEAALRQAQTAYEAARARYDALYAEPDADLVASARAQVKQAQANLDRLRDPATENEIAEAEAMVRQAEAQLDLLKSGARTEEIAAAQATVDQAAAGLQQAQASLADTQLRAPFTGTLATLYVKEGEQVVAGMPVVQLADLTAWQIETDDLTELDVVKIQEGDRLVLHFDAIEDLELGGTVVRIKPLGQEKLGDITYTVVIRPDEQDSRLRWNMTAVATIP